MATGKTVLVLGGGVGGVVTAHRLRRYLPRGDRIVLVDREPQHLFQPSLLWLIVGKREPEQIRRPLDRLRRKGIEVIQGEIEQIDPAEKTVRVSGQEWRADAIVLALGADLAPDQIPGLASAGHNLYSLSGATAFRDALGRFSGGRIVLLTAAPAYKCPAAPYEAAMLIEGELRRRGIRSQVQVDFYAAEPGPMGVAGPQVTAAVRGMVEQKGIRYHPEHQVQSVDGTARRLVFTNGATADYDLLLYVPPHKAPDVVRVGGLTGDSGWVPVDRHTLETRYPFVFAIGDVATIPLKLGKPLPKAGVFAHAQAEVVAANLARAWGRAGPDRRFDGYGSCFVETGDGKGAFGSGDFYAEPTPQVKLYGPGPWWHWGKVLLEKRWLRTWF
ncbi:MAG: NAD(P)/FAD-dependent oxidoreductase [Gemmatimonadetes bacterium]|nr:NAD(P)/FAD-dependent oxidoreductase [Gemmatimonadota bacterium]